jgi:hypothetical protein
MFSMDLLEEVVQHATSQMLRLGFHPPTLFIAGSKSRMGKTFTVFEGSHDETIAAMVDEGKDMAKSHPELGALVHVFFVTHMRAVPKETTTASINRKEALLIHGMEVATRKNALMLYRVKRDAQGVFWGLEQVPVDVRVVPENPWISAFVQGFQEGALAGK